MMPSHATVEAQVGDPKLVEERRAEIVRAAVKLFSERGYYDTTIQQIAREAGIRVGLVYQYFRDKDDVLFLSLKDVLERLRDATVLTCRSTKSLRPGRRRCVEEGETRTNRILEGYLKDCVSAGYVERVTTWLLVYQFVRLAHAWTLKGCAFRKRYRPEKCVKEGLKPLVDPFLTEKGRRVRR